MGASTDYGTAAYTCLGAQMVRFYMCVTLKCHQNDRMQSRQVHEPYL